MPRRLINQSSKLTFSEKGGRGQPPLISEEFGEKHNIVRRTNFGFGVDARAGPGDPSSPDPPSSGLSA